jgi:hypothetical protein
VNLALAVAIPLTAAGIFLLVRELRNKRPVSLAAFAGEVLMTAGLACSAAWLASGRLWPLTFVPALAALGPAAAAVTALAVRRAEVRR